MKFKLFRIVGRLDREFNKDKLIAVEYADDIHSASDLLIKDVMHDLSEAPENQGCAVSAYPPEEVESKRPKHYVYKICGVVAPPNAPENTLVDYGITAESE